MDRIIIVCDGKLMSFNINWAIGVDGAELFMKLKKTKLGVPNWNP